MHNVALLEFFTGPSGTLVFLVRPDLRTPLVFEIPAVTDADLRRCSERLLIDFHGLPPAWDAAPHAQRYRDALALPPAVNAAKRGQPILDVRLRKPAFAYDLTYWERLAESLLPDALRRELDDCNLLCIVPHGPLHALPFAALRFADGTRLIERFGLSIAHSASVLRACQRRNRARIARGNHRPRSCFVAAVAAADDEDPGEFEADGDALASLFEGNGRPATVTRLVGARSGTLPPASKVLIRERIVGHDVVHLACHGFFGLDQPGDDPLDSGLLVSDGDRTPALAEIHRLTPAARAAFTLSAREVFQLELAADLVTLRACSSGRADVRAGDELIGLTRAFLFAGTPSLVVSLWNVQKRSSRRLLNEFYRLWLNEQAPLPKWRALQLAQQRLLADPETSHPYHWAPFILVGDWL